MQRGKSRRQVHQLHFTSWPDHGLPTRPDGTNDTDALIEFVAAVRQRQLELNFTQNAPILVHCRYDSLFTNYNTACCRCVHYYEYEHPRFVHSAGIGRTGTFIALDHFTQFLKAKEENTLNIFAYILQMRKHRPHMVQVSVSWDLLRAILFFKFKYVLVIWWSLQGVKQYVYLHECVLKTIHNLESSPQCSLPRGPVVNRGFDPRLPDELYCKPVTEQLSIPMHHNYI